MKELCVQLTRQSHCPICIGSGVINELPKAVGKTQSAFILTDSNVDPLYSNSITKILQNNGIDVSKFVFPAGEQSKHLKTVEEILTAMHETNLSRSDVLIALGGGVVGDIGGFCGAIYKRGIRVVQIPTTLLAQVDSSVGGKTGVDFFGNKNSVGLISQPHWVLIDTDTLKTLPKDEILNGLAEMIKYACIESESMFDSLLHAKDYISHIGECIEIKARIVMNDEQDVGERMKLNFGHTLGHAIESDSNYQIPHGKAVAMGMSLIAKYGEERGFTKPGTHQKLVTLLKQWGLPFEYGGDLERAKHLSLQDKKVLDGGINIILLKEIGCAEIKKLTRQEWISS